MKIAIVTSFPRNPAAPHGGVETVSVNLVKALARVSDNEVHVVTCDRTVSQIETSVWENSTVHRLPAARQNLLVYAVGKGRQQIHRFLHELRPDVIHAHDTYGIMVKGIARPRVFTVHGFIHEDTRYGGERLAWLRAALWKRVETASWREQPHIISISPYVRERLRGIACGTIHDIENPIAEECFAIRSALDQPVILSAATICERKNTLGLLKAFECLWRSGQKVRLRLAGKPVEPEYERLVHEFIKAAGISEHVDLLGSLSAMQVREEMQKASIFALLSFEEGAPMGIAEAMAVGLPIVTSNRCGMPYMVRDGQSGFLVNPADPREAAGAFAQILTSDALRMQFGTDARLIAVASYHPDCVAERTFAVYQRAMMTDFRDTFLPLLPKTMTPRQGGFSCSMLRTSHCLFT